MTTRTDGHLDPATRLAHLTARQLCRGLVMLVVVIFVASLIKQTSDLKQRYRVTLASIELLEAERDRLQERHSAHRAEKAFLQSSAGVAAEARRLGYGWPGELRVMFVREGERGTPAARD